MSNLDAADRTTQGSSPRPRPEDRDHSPAITEGYSLVEVVPLSRPVAPLLRGISDASVIRSYNVTDDTNGTVYGVLLIQLRTRDVERLTNRLKDAGMEYAVAYLRWAPGALRPADPTHLPSRRSPRTS